MDETVLITDGGVALSPLGLDDFEAHLAGEDAELIRWLSGGPAVPDGLRDYLHRCEAWWAASGPFRNFGIRVGPEQILAGTMDVQIGQPYLKAGQANLAYGLYPTWRGHGIATRAVHLACRYATDIGCTEAVIRCHPANGSSVAVARRAGFTHRCRATADDGTTLDWFTFELKNAPPIC